MNLRFSIFFLVIASSKLLGEKITHKFLGNIWQSVTPGKLLSTLDLMTADNEQNQANVAPTKPTILLKTTMKNKRESISTNKQKKSQSKNRRLKKSYPKRRMSNDDNSEVSTSASSEKDDYANAYDDFVHRYFNDAAENYFTENNASGSEEADDLSSELSNESGSTTPLDAQPFDSKLKVSKKNCRNVRRKDEICTICRNSRNNERSETCSFERTSEPERYGYETQRKYITSRDKSDDSNEENEEDDDTSASVAETKLVVQTVKPDNSANEQTSNSSCIKRTTGDKSCYYCRNSLGVLNVNCSNTTTQKPLKQKPLKYDADVNKKRRTYRRTLSYTYEKGLDSNETKDLPIDVKGSDQSLKTLPENFSAIQ